MQLRNDIFLRVALSILLPMTALVLAATYYTEQRYEDSVRVELSGSLESIVGEIGRRLASDRETFAALATSPAIEQYIPVMQAAAAGELHPEFFPRTDDINRFLEAFQKAVPSMNTLRVLDSQANTLVKIRFGQSAPASFDGIESFPFAEEEIDDEQYLNRLYELPDNEIGVTLLSQTKSEQEEDTNLPMLDYILPMSREGTFVGYLVVNMLGEQINRILEYARRPRNVKILIAEINPEEPDRHEVLLYDDSLSLNFTDNKSQERRLKNVLSEDLYKQIIGEPEGYVTSKDNSESIYFIEYMPYPDLLVHWIVMLRVDQNAIDAPFQKIRIISLIVAALILAVSLWLAGLTANQIARPVTQLAKTIKKYANGGSKLRVEAKDSSQEVLELAASFNYMADTLDKAARERDRAQQTMLQQNKLASIGQMAAGIGHELNNPLNNILTLSKLLERNADGDDERSKQDIASLREETLRASGIVQGILNFARQVPPDFSQFKIEPWIKDTFALVKQQANKNAILLVSEGEMQLSIYGDRGQLQQVLINLLLNAIQASARDSVVEVSVSADEDTVSISVSDKGIGIDEDDFDKIFDPFYSSKQVGDGFGLGLSISMGIIEQHGGKLSVRNNEVGVLAIMAVPIKSKQGYE